MTESSSSDSSIVASNATGSGSKILLHPLPLLNITEHYNRARLSSAGDTKLVGALLGTQVNRDISIVNSFELVIGPKEATGDDIDMSTGSLQGGGKGLYALDMEFFETRKEQFKTVFPTQEVVGWYTISSKPTSDDMDLHQAQIDNPVFLHYNTAHPIGSQELPITIYESLEDSKDSTSSPVKFVKVEYGVESGEAERIAVDGVSRGGMGNHDDDAVVGGLVTQRNAIRMLHERISVLVEYIRSVSEQKSQPDHSILRQISSLLATLPTIDAEEFRQELATEYEDVEITSYLSNITKQISALSSYSDRHHAVHPGHSNFDDSGWTTVQRGFKGRRR